MFHILQRAGLLPPDAAQTSEVRHQLINKLDAELAEQYIPRHDRVAGHLLPYRLRCLALDQPLPPFAFGRALFHLAQRRGFLSNRKSSKNADEEGAVKAGISELQEKMRQTGSRTLGEYLSGLDSEQQRTLLYALDRSRDVTAAGVAMSGRLALVSRRDNQPPRAYLIEGTNLNADGVNLTHNTAAYAGSITATQRRWEGQGVSRLRVTATPALPAGDTLRGSWLLVKLGSWTATGLHPLALRAVRFGSGGSTPETGK